MISDPSHPAQHIGNTVALFLPAASFWAHWNPVLTGALGVLGVVWYGVLFYDRFVKDRWPKNK